MPNVVRSVTRLVDQDDVAGLLSALADGYALTYDHATGAFVLRLWMTRDIVPESFAVPAGYTCIYPGMQVPPGVVVSVVGTLMDVTHD